MSGKLAFLSLGALLSGALLLGCGGGGGGGNSGPTEPAGTAQVAGTWNGSWSVAGVGLTTRLVLTQSGSALAGTFSLLSATFNVEGTADASRRVSWHVVGGGCGSLTGDGTANSLSPTRIDGTIDLNTLGCTDNQHVTGPVAWVKASAAASATGKRATPEDLGRLLARSRP